MVEGRLFAGRIPALLADRHPAGGILAPVGDGADGRLTGAASRDAAVAVHGGYGGVAAHPDDEVVVALSAGVEIGFGPGVVGRDLQLHLAHFQLKVRRLSQKRRCSLCGGSRQKQPAQHEGSRKPCDLVHRVALPSFVSFRLSQCALHIIPLTTRLLYTSPKEGSSSSPEVSQFRASFRERH